MEKKEPGLLSLKNETDFGVHVAFVNLILACLTPFALSLLVVIGVRLNVSKEIKFCTEKVTTLQREHRLLTHKLLDTNFYAKGLRIARASAEVAAKVDPTRASLVALMAIKATQRVLSLYQKGLIFKGQMMYQKLQIEMFSKGYMPKSLFNGLAVTPFPKNSASPSYKLIKNYKNKKKIKFTKLVDSQKGFIGALKRFKGLQQYFVYSCGATINKKEGKPSKIKLI